MQVSHKKSNTLEIRKILIAGVSIEWFEVHKPKFLTKVVTFKGTEVQSFLDKSAIQL